MRVFPQGSTYGKADLQVGLPISFVKECHSLPFTQPVLLFALGFHTALWSHNNSFAIACFLHLRWPAALWASRLITSSNHSSASRKPIRSSFSRLWVINLTKISLSISSRASSVADFGSVTERLFDPYLPLPFVDGQPSYHLLVASALLTCIHNHIAACVSGPRRLNAARGSSTSWQSRTLRSLAPTAQPWRS